MARRDGVSAARYASPPRERSEEVYRAALRLFREKGYHATSMQDIAACALPSSVPSPHPTSP